MKLYTTPTCGPCRQVKQTLKAEKLEHLVEIVDDVNQFPVHVRSVPTLKTDNGAYIIGTSDILFHLRNLKETQN